MESIDEVAEGRSQGNVLFLDNYSEVPESTLPLDETGKKIYDERCKALLKAGALTIKTKDYVEQLAAASDALAYSIKNGRKGYRAAAELHRSATRNLDKIDADQVIATPGQGQGTFSKFGFAKRARERQIGNN